MKKEDEWDKISDLVDKLAFAIEEDMQESDDRELPEKLLKVADKFRNDRRPN